jgi:hypothetical protein
MIRSYTLLDLGFTFKYFDNIYTEVSISLNGYVCLGNNYYCRLQTRPSGHDIVVGLNYYLDPTREESGHMYYKILDSNSSDFKSARIYLNLFNPDFEPQQIFMITYDNVLPFFRSSASVTSFQIYLSTDSVKSFVTFNFKSCPTDLTLEASSGLNYNRNDGILQEVIIANGEQCKGSNVGQKGIWVSDVTSKGKLKIFEILKIIINKKIKLKLDMGGFFNSLNNGIFGCKAFYICFIINFLYFIFFDIVLSYYWCS